MKIVGRFTVNAEQDCLSAPRQSLTQAPPAFQIKVNIPVNVTCDYSYSMIVYKIPKIFRSLCRLMIVSLLLIQVFEVFFSYDPLEEHECYTRDDDPYNKNGKVFAHFIRKQIISHPRRHPSARKKSYEKPLTSIPRSEYDRSNGLRDIIERRGVAVAKYLGQHVDWVNTHGNIC
jgi:hypothetical protein